MKRIFSTAHTREKGEREENSEQKREGEKERIVEVEEGRRENRREGK